MRPVLARVHRWAGLFLAVWLLVLAGSGTILVFHDELDSVLNRDVYSVEPGDTPLTPAALVARATDAYPGSYVAGLDVPSRPDRSAKLHLRSRHDTPAAYARHREVFADPYTGVVLGDRGYGEAKLDRRHLLGAMYGLHRDFLLGEPMLWLLGLVAFLWLGMQVVGAYLAFPRLKFWKRSLRIRKGATGIVLFYDLHRSLGLWLLPATVVMAITAVSFQWSGSFSAVVSFFSPVTPHHYSQARTLPEPVYAVPAAFDHAAGAAQAATNGAGIDRIRQLPDKGLLWVYSFDRRDIYQEGRRWTFVSVLDGQVVSDRHQSEGSAGDAVLAWRYPLHSGKAFGWLGRVIVLCAGLAVLAGLISGLAVWFRKRR